MEPFKRDPARTNRSTWVPVSSDTDRTLQILVIARMHRTVWSQDFSKYDSKINLLGGLVQFFEL